MKIWLLPLLGLVALAFPWACGNSPTNPAATPVFTPTATNWGNLTSTWTMTQTMTQTPTATNQGGFTSTPTVTPTQTATATSTATNLGGNTSTVTSTFTITSTITNTSTATLTITPVTLTPTYTPLPTSTPSSTITPPPNYKTQWTLGIKNPNGLAYDSTHQIYYIAEGGAVSQILVLNSSGVSQFAQTQYNSVPFTEPYGVAVNNGGTTLFVLDGGIPGAVYAFTSTTTTSWVTAGSVTTGGTVTLSGPEGIAVDSTGVTVFVSDTGNNQIVPFIFSGNSFTPQTPWTSGTQPFSQPSGITVDSTGNVFVADSGNHIIQKYTPGSSWTSYSTNNLSLSSDVFGVGLDTAGNIYACDVANSAVQQLGSNGAFLAAWTGGTGNALFNSPDGIVFTGTDYVVSDYENGSSSTGSLVVLGP